MKPREPLVLIVGAGDSMVAEVESLLTAFGFGTARAPRAGLLGEVRRLDPDVVVGGEDSAGEVEAALAADEECRLTPVVTIGRPAGVEATGRGSMDAAASMPFRFLDEPYREYLMPPFTPRELAASLNGAARVKRLRDEVHLREQALRRMAIRDRATDVFTWAYGLERVKQEVARGKRYGYPVSCLRLAMQRSDDAGLTGPALSDDILRQAAVLLLRLTREADVICRSHAERFMILLPQTDRSGLEVLAERVRLAIERHVFTDGAGEARLTVFVGATTFPSPEVSGAGSLIRRAAEAVRLARQGERGRAVVL